MAIKYSDVVQPGVRTLVELDDTPAGYDNNKVLTSTVDGSEWTTPDTGVDATDVPTVLLDLTDTPASYDDGKVLTSTTDGTEWTTPDVGVDATAVPETLLDLTDTPAAYDDGKFLKSTADGTEWAEVDTTSAAGATTLLELTDTPAGYDDGKVLTSTADGTEWTTPAAGGGSGDLLTIPATVSNGEYKGIIKVGTVGEDVSFGDILTYDFTSEEYLKADATDSTSIPARVIVCEDSTADSQCDLLSYGVITNSSWSWSEGDIYVDTTSGTMTQTAPSGTGEFVQIVGYALTATSIFFDPDKTVIELS
jgi:hypothetical protein